MFDTANLQYIILFSFVIIVLAILIFYYYLRFLPQHHAHKEMEQNYKRLEKEIDRLTHELKTLRHRTTHIDKISLVANISAGILHQLAQPVTAIHGLARFLAKGAEAEGTIQESLVLIESRSAYLKEMLDNLMQLLLDKEVNREKISVNAVLQESIKLMADELRIARIHWNLVLSNDITKIEADKIHLQQVFMNIIVNAIQALRLFPLGEIREFTILTRNEHNKVVIIFSNTGAPLTEEQQKSIFDPFYSTKKEGVGIGLALCRRMVEEYSGTIDVSCDNNKTDFMVQFPAIT